MAIQKPMMNLKESMQIIICMKEAGGNDQILGYLGDAVLTFE